MKKTTLLLVVAMLLLITSTSPAQFRMSIAPVLGMNFNLHTGSDLGSTGTGIGLVIGGQAIMSFSPMFGLVSGLTFYDNRSGSTSRTYPSQQYNDATANENTSASIAYLQFENLFMLRLPGTGFFFVAGPVVGFNLEGSAETTVKTVANYDPTQSVTSKSKGSIKDMLVRFELKLGAGYDFPIARNIYIYPQVTFGFGLTKVVSDVSWRILSFQALGGVKFVII